MRNAPAASTDMRWPSRSSPRRHASRARARPRGVRRREEAAPPRRLRRRVGAGHLDAAAPVVRRRGAGRPLHLRGRRHGRRYRRPLATFTRYDTATERGGAAAARGDARSRGGRRRRRRLRRRGDDAGREHAGRLGLGREGMAAEGAPAVGALQPRRGRGRGPNLGARRLRGARSTGTSSSTTPGRRTWAAGRRCRVRTTPSARSRSAARSGSRARRGARIRARSISTPRAETPGGAGPRCRSRWSSSAPRRPDRIHAVWESVYQTYDVSERRWRQGPRPLVTRHALKAFVAGGALYTVGSCTTAGDSPIVERLVL